MQQQLLRLVEHMLPAGTSVHDAEHWPDTVRPLVDQFVVLADRMFNDLRMATPGRLFNESIVEHLMTSHPGVVLCEARLRPESNYYADIGCAVPAPENPAGLHATGLALSILLCRGYPGRETVRHAHLAIELEVWGGYERALFAELMRDHRHTMAGLLSSRALTLQTAVPFDNVDAAKKAPAFHQLQLYFDNLVDRENCFTVGHQVNLGDPQGEALAALVRLAAVYDCAMGYCLPAQDRERPYGYLEMVRGR